MKKYLILITLGLLVTYLHAQETTGVQFIKGLNWQQVKAKAKSENKNIFVDCYATWCGPCKMMDKNIYPTKLAGDAVNDKFINVKVQMDVTRNDAPDVQAWYADAKNLMNTYHIGVFPTLLFFSPDGVLSSRLNGVVKNDNDFSKVISECLDSVQKYNGWINSFKEATMPYNQMPAFYLKAKSLEDKETADTVAKRYKEEYLFKLSDQDLLNKANLEIMTQMMTGTRAKDFAFFRSHLKGIDKVSADQYFAEKTIIGVIDRSAVYPLIAALKTGRDWNHIEQVCEKQYGRLGMLAVRQERFFNYWWRGMVEGSKDCADAFGMAYQLYYDEIGPLNPFSVNDASFCVFQYVNDKKVLLKALNVMKSHRDDNVESMDTYANLLYKIGNKVEAVYWENKAVDWQNDLAAKAAAIRKKAPAPDLLFQQTLEKMEKGIPTW